MTKILPPRRSSAGWATRGSAPPSPLEPLGVTALRHQALAPFPPRFRTIGRRQESCLISNREEDS
jgi:hypothetical protein